MALNSPPPDDALRTRRFAVITALALLFFAVLAVRLWYLQVISVNRYQLLAQKNRTRYVPIAAPRGEIYDRKGRLLVGNRPAFTVAVSRQDVVDKEQLLSRLATYLHCDKQQLEQIWQKHRYYPRYRPIPLKRDIDRDTVDVLTEHSIELPGMLIEVQPVRSYPYHEAAAHLFGHIGAITEEELQLPRYSDYHAGEYIGKSGLEKHLEQYLKGVAGEKLLEVDVKGQELRQLQIREPLPGRNVILTIDRDLQLCTEHAFGDQAGAAVVIDVNNGDILAMVSRPAFDPELFAVGISNANWRKLMSNPDHPLQARAISGQYPPGSTYKMVTALAALDAGVITPHTSVNCTGRLPVGNRDFRCWKKTGHGPTTLRKALRESCDVWFYQVALNLGIERMSAMARQLGLGRSYALPLDNVRAGLIPDKQWKRRRYNRPWYKGETAIAAIGQGYVLATPLQLAVMMSTIANGGTLFKPQLVRQISDADGNIIKQYPAQVIHGSTLNRRHLVKVKQGLEDVVNNPRGTGKACALKTIKVAGKTGTAQVIRLKDDPADGSKPDKEKIAYRHRDHALFVAYAPADKPQIALAVIVEHGQHGGSAAAPIAKKIFQQYFDLGQARTITNHNGE